MSQTPCAGKWELFDATDRASHMIARELCAQCPVLRQCAIELHQVINDHKSGGQPVGTWAGRLLGERPAISTRERPGRRKTEVDPVVVDRFIGGDHTVHLTHAERVEVVRRWPGSLRQLEKLGWQPYRYQREAASA